MLIIMEITLIDKCHKGLSDLVDNPSRISQNAALISRSVTALLTITFVFTYVESRFSHNVTHIIALSRRPDTNEKCHF